MIKLSLIFIGLLRGSGMSSDSRTMAFAAVFSIHVDRETPQIRPGRERVAIHGASSDDMQAAMPTGPMKRPDGPGRPEQKPPGRALVPYNSAAAPKEAESLLDKHKKDRRYPRNYDLVLLNTERIPTDYMKDVLQRIFHEEASRANVLALFQTKIHEGPFTRDVARSKADQVREDAACKGMPAPQMRYVRAQLS
jgi:ATP-dependent Clp protease adapter protein ClpS